MRRAVGVFAGVVLLAVAGLGPDAGAQVIDDENPRTGAEASNRGNWSSHEELTERLTTLAATSALVDIAEIGRTAQDRSMFLVSVADPAVEPRATVLFVCSQHGDEPAPREACTRLVEQLVDGSERSRRILSVAEILFVPDANPDGRAAGTRYNTQALDVNRDHLALDTAEGQAIARVLRDRRPDLVIDAHEYIYAVPHASDDDVQFLWIRNRNAHPSLHELSKSLAVDHVEPAARDAGYTTDTYGSIDLLGHDVAQNGGGPDPKGLREAGSLRNAVTLLLESNANPRFTSIEENISDEAMTERRIDSQLVMFHATLDFVVERTDELLAARAAALATAGRSAPLFIGGTESTPPTPTETIDPAPCAWVVPAAGTGDVARFVDLWAVRTRTEPGGAVVIPLDQEAAPILPFALDPASSLALTKATRQPCASATGSTPGGSTASEADAAPGTTDRLPATGTPTPPVALLAAAAAMLAARRLPRDRVGEGGTLTR